MTGINDFQGHMWVHISSGQRFPEEPQLRTVEAHSDTILKELSPEFYAM
jgi:hypothetical protein